MSSVKKKNLEPEIIYQDKYIFLVNKPSGWVILKVDTYQGFTLQDWVEEKIQDSSFARRNGIAHRLDKDTWGIILGAKDKKSFDFLQSQFKHREVEKEYRALVRGELKSEGKVVSPIGRLSHNRLKMTVTASGKPAETKFKPIGQYKIDGNIYTLVVVWPKTGRTHQIRIHFKYLGHPIFGDQLYGGKREKGKEMFLVARKIKFIHPQFHNKVEFEIDLPYALERIINDAQKTKER